MNARTVGIVVALAFFSLAQAAEKKEGEWYGPKPLKGDYQVYGGTLSEKLRPTPKDRKVATNLARKAATCCAGGVRLNSDRSTSDWLATALMSGRPI